VGNQPGAPVSHGGTRRGSRRLRTGSGRGSPGGRPARRDPRQLDGAAGDFTVTERGGAPWTRAGDHQHRRRRRRLRRHRPPARRPRRRAGPARPRALHPPRLPVSRTTRRYGRRSSSAATGRRPGAAFRKAAIPARVAPAAGANAALRLVRL